MIVAGCPTWSGLGLENGHVPAFWLLLLKLPEGLAFDVVEDRLM